MKRIFILGVAYFFINCCVYSTHNYMLKIISAGSEITPKQFAVLDMLLIVKFVGSFFWTNMADRTKMHRAIIASGLMGYAFFLSMFHYAPVSMKAHGLNIWTILYYLLFTFFLSAVYATLDAFCLEYLESKEKEKKLFGRIKLFGCAGHSTAPLCLVLMQNNSPDQTDNVTPICLSFLFAVIGSLHILLTFGMLEKKNVAVIKKKKDPLVKRIQKNLVNIKALFSLSLIMFLVSVTLQGVHRNLVSTFLEMYADETGISRKELSCAFILRFIPEASMLFLTGYIDNLIGTYWMIFIGILFGIFRPVLYSCLNPSATNKGLLVALVYLSELSKGCFSGLFNYACAKLVKDLCTQKTRSLAQGLFNGCYGGLAPCMSGLLAYCLIEKPNFTINESHVKALYTLGAILGTIGIIPMVCLIRGKIKREKDTLHMMMKMNDIDSVSEHIAINEKSG